MPVLAGIVSRGSSEELATRLDAMLAQTPQLPWLRAARCVSEGAAVGGVWPEAGPFLFDAPDAVIAFHGEAYGLTSRPCSGGEVCELLLDRFRQHGPKALVGLDGLYVAAVWEKRDRRLTLVNDRYGFKKLYYWADAEQFLFASRTQCFLSEPAFPKRLDVRALAEFFTLSYLLEDRTLFESVRVLPPASILTWQNARLSISAYWDYVFEPRSDGGDVQAAAGEMAELLIHAVRKRRHDRLCLQVTGGLDSRAVAGAVAACQDLRPVRAVTVGHAHSHDVRFGRAIARACGFEHTLVPIDARCYEQYAETAALRTEGFISAQNGWIFAIDAYLADRYPLGVMNGFLGDCLSGAHLPQCDVGGMTEDAVFSHVYARMYGDAAEGTLARLLRPEIFRQVRGSTRQTIRRCFDARPDLGVLNRCDYIDLHQRQRRFIASHIEFLDPFCRVIDPFTDNALVDGWLTLPLSLRMGQRAYRQAIVTHFPRVARIPRTGSGIPLKTTWLYEGMVRARMFAHYKLLPRFSAGRLGGHNMAAAAHPTEWLRGASRAFFERHMRRAEWCEDVLDVQGVRAFATDFLEGRHDDWGTACLLLMFALWRDIYCGGEQRSA
ncbi:MAG TPA: asparagine synthase-related protein [Candidatus Hydrogenedentes bacterium]|nr:asparagine synthase-related protein [Candidatus Hydrogenedentota bacterium]